MPGTSGSFGEGAGAGFGAGASACIMRAKTAFWLSLAFFPASRAFTCKRFDSAVAGVTAPKSASAIANLSEGASRQVHRLRASAQEVTALAQRKP